MARKKLGQHFLHNPDVLRRVADALSLCAGDRVLEIGPGRGALTREILQMPSLGGLLMIEKDSVLAHQLARKYQIPKYKLQTPNSKTSFAAGQANTKFNPPAGGPNSKLIVLEGDALEILPEISKSYKLKTISYKLIGNIPFYITGKLFRVIGELEHKPEITVLMIQKEVAERVSAKPPHMSLLAASVQIWANVEYLFSVSKKEFTPMPKVDSAVIRLRTRNNPVELRHGAGAELHAESHGKYYDLIKILFKQPRKTILNNLSDGLHRPKEELLPILNRLGLDARSRPQIFSVEQITKLLQIVKMPRT